MKKPTLVLAALLLTAPLFAQTTIPQDVLGWYTDGVSVYVDLTKDVDGAQDAGAAARAFDRARAAIEQKGLRARYQALRKAYPAYFEDSDSGAETFVPPAEWMKVWQEYSEALERYGTSMQKVARWYDDPGLQASLERFGEAMDLESSEDGPGDR